MGIDAATGAIVVSVFGTGNPPWVQGSARPLQKTESSPISVALLETKPQGAMQIGKNVAIHGDATTLSRDAYGKP